MSRKRFSVSPERAAAVELDPNLVLAALKKIPASDWRERRGWHDLIELCAETCAERVGFDVRDRYGFEVLVALKARMRALSAFMENGQLEPGDASAEAVAEATCAARLLWIDDRFRFQAREFFALLDHAEAERQK